MHANRIYTAAAVHLTAVLECLASEVLKVAGDESVKENKKRIHPGHLTQAVKNNDELMQLLQNVTIPSADVAPRGGKW
ncbi:Probable histone H2AXa [Striga hermonthica]|uniref:Histone H2A n=1 Tax=Striga hermonthica TaxID=68872 RepID=A0A9N7MKL9_STRHE|nr:Probable histone H2AXa [Striga hermonthica]